MRSHQPMLAATGKGSHYLGHPFDYWARRFRESQGDDRYFAGKALASFGERSIPFLLDALQFEDYGVAASHALYWMGRLAFPAVATLLQSPNPLLRKRGLWLAKDLSLARGLCHEGLEFANAALGNALEDEDPEIRCEAAQVLRCLAPPLPPRSIMALAKAARDQDVRVRFWAVRALVCVEADNEQGTDCLLEALRDPDAGVRLAAAECLELVKPSSKKAHEALTAALDDPVEAVRILVQRLLETLETDRTDNQVEIDSSIIREMNEQRVHS